MTRLLGGSLYDPERVGLHRVKGLRYKIVLKKIEPYTPKCMENIAATSIHYIAKMEAADDGGWVPYSEVKEAIEMEVQNKLKKIDGFLLG